MNLESPPKYFDAHGHPNFVAYKYDRDEVIRRTLDVGVWMNVVGTQKDTSKQAVELAEKYSEGVYATIGLHPIHTGKSFHDKEELGEGGKEFTSRGEEFDYEYYKNLAKSEKVVAIGECGLDYFRMNNELGIINYDLEEERQKETFRKHIDLALEVDKPLMLHIRNGSNKSAYKDAFNILNTYYQIHNLRLRGNLHFFAGTWEEAEPFLKIGFYFSFGGVLTITHDYDNVVRKLPLDKILSETDCPYIAPVPYRGKRNEPVYVIEVVKKIVEIRGENFEKVREKIFENSLRFFNIKK